MVSADDFYLQLSTQEQDNRSQKVNVRWRRVMTVLKVFESVGNNMREDLIISHDTTLRVFLGSCLQFLIIAYL